jgi:ribosomal protein S18 acetylase RimI-like enzyme
VTTEVNVKRRARELYERMAVGLAASWERYAAGSSGASVLRATDAAVAVFPAAPERTVYNNALLQRGLDPARAAEVVTTVEGLYADAGIDGYAVWAHEHERPAIAGLTARGYRLDTTTRAMAMELDAIRVPRPRLALAAPDWGEYLRIIEAPEGLLAGVDPDDFQVRIATLDGVNVAAAMAYDHDGDCGIYNLVTLPHARRRGLGSALTARHLHDARERGCTTASLQATEIAERVYAAVGFRDLGRILEFVR